MILNPMRHAQQKQSKPYPTGPCSVILETRNTPLPTRGQRRTPMMKTTPELEAAKLWRDVIRRRNNLATADPDDVAAATTAYAVAIAAYKAVKAATA